MQAGGLGSSPTVTAQDMPGPGLGPESAIPLGASHTLKPLVRAVLCPSPPPKSTPLDPSCALASNVSQPHLSSIQTQPNAAPSERPSLMSCSSFPALCFCTPSTSWHATVASSPYPLPSSPGGGIHEDQVFTLLIAVCTMPSTGLGTEWRWELMWKSKWRIRERCVSHLVRG